MSKPLNQKRGAEPRPHPESRLTSLPVSRSRTWISSLVLFLSWIVFLSYVLFMINRLFYHAYSGYTRSAFVQVEYNLIPFNTIMNYIRNYDHFNLDIWLYNLFGNVAAFMPLGFFLPLLFLSMKRFLACTFTACAASFAVELLQIGFRVGSFDVDDILLNTLGGCLGFGIWYVIARIVTRR